MLIVDAQIHLWEKGTPSAHHRQEPYSAEQAIAGMDEAGVDRALIHPVLWDPDSNELALKAVRKYPGRFAIMGWFYLDDRSQPVRGWGNHAHTQRCRPPQRVALDRQQRIEHLLRPCGDEHAVRGAHRSHAS